MSRRAITRPATFVAALLLAVTVVGLQPGTPDAAAQPDGADRAAPVAPISHEGRWLTDATGRVLLVHGVNLVAKEPGETPADMGFADDDAEWIVENGFDVVRLGTTAASIMPTPGAVDTAYLDSFAETARMLTDHGLLVLVDLHQDGWGPTLGSDGFPGWMTLTRGEENTGTPFPLYYITNPAIQAAFQSFWDNDDGPNGPLQDDAAEIWRALAGAVADNPGIIGYDLLNEPWPGFDWNGCITPEGCAAQDVALDAFHARMTGAVRSQDPDRLIFGEPYVLFNFGMGPTHVGLPGGDPQSGLSWHLYTEDPERDPDVIAFAEDWAAQTGGALFNTEFGAISDPDGIDHLTGLLDSALSPWIWWAYNEQMMPNMHATPSDENLWSLDAVNAIVRPHPTAVAGTPFASDYDPAARTFQFSYTTDRAGGGTFAADTASSFQLTSRTYPDGYRVDVHGGTVVSEAGAAQLLVEADPGSDCVTVAVAPEGAAAPVAPADGCGTGSGDGTPDGNGPDGGTPGAAAPATPVAARPAFTG